MKKFRKLLSCLLALSTALTMTVGNMTSYAEEPAEGEAYAAPEPAADAADATADSDTSSDSDDGDDTDYIQVGDYYLPIGGLNGRNDTATEEETRRILEEQDEIVDFDLDDAVVTGRAIGSGSSSYLYENEFKTDAEKQYYQNMDDACFAVLNSTVDYTETVTYNSGTAKIIAIVPYDNSISDDRADVLFSLFKFSNPQYYFLSNWRGKGSDGIQSYKYLHFVDYAGYDYSQYAQRQSSQAKLDNLTNSWMTDIDKISSEEGKESAVNNKIIDYLTYDTISIDGAHEELESFNQSAISGVERQTTVCAGYGMLTAYFMNMAGLDSFCVTSDGHQWNMVKIYDNWYEVDNTWADQDKGSNPHVWDIWLNKCHNTMLSQDISTGNDGGHTYDPKYWTGVTLPTTSYDEVQVPANPVVSKIEIATQPTKTFNLGDAFSTGSGSIKATYSDGTTKTVSMTASGVTVNSSAYKSNVDGTYTITVTYGGKSLTYDVTVTDPNASTTVTGIAIKSAPTATYTGDDLNFTGSKITVTYKDGHTADVAITSAMVTGYDKTKTTRQTVTVTYEGKTATFTITLTALAVSKIEIVTQPKKDFDLGDAFSTGSGSIKATYNSGKTETLLMTASGVTVNSSAYKSNVDGTYTITVTYGGKSVTYTVTVSDPNAATTVTKIAIKTAPTATYTGDDLDFTDSKLTVTYKDGHTAEVAITSAMVTGYDKTKTTRQTVTVTYEGKTATFTITLTALAVSKIEIVTQPKKDFDLGDAFSTGSGSIKATYNSGKTETIAMTAEGVTVNSSAYKSNVDGTYTITVTYGGKSVTYTVTVSDPNAATTVTKIAIKTAPTATYTGDDLDFTDSKLTVTYKDGHTADVAITSAMVTGYDKTKTTRQTVTVTYEGKTATFTITLTALAVTGIEWETEPTKTYELGEALKKDGTILVTYNSGKTETIAMTAEGVTVDDSKFNSEKAGTYAITVKYAGKQLQYSVTVTMSAESAFVTVSDGTDTLYYEDLTKAFKAITDLKNANADYTVTVNKTVTEKTLTFPKNAKSLTITTSDGAVIKTTATSLAPNCALTLDADFVHVDNKGNPDGKKIAVKAAKESTLTINKGFDDLGAVSGTATAVLIIDDDITCDGIATFAKVTINDSATVTGKVSAIGTLEGTLILKDAAKSSAAITEADGAVIKLYQGTDRSGKIILPKLTVADPVDMTITVKTTTGADADIAGQTILQLAKQDNIASLETKIKFTNKDGTNTLSAVQYKKDVRAEWLDALTLNNGTEDVNYSSLEKLFEQITADSAAADKAKPKQAYKSYTITLNTDMAPEKFALPMKAAGITILGGGHALSLTGVTSLAPKYAFTLKNVNITARDKQGKGAALAINGSEAMDIEDVTFDGKSLTINSSKEDTVIKNVTTGNLIPLIIKGGTKNDLTISGCPLVNQLSGFDTITLSDEMEIEKTFSTNTLDIGTTGNLVTGSDPTARKFTPAGITIKKELKANGGKITLSEGFKPLTISAATSGNIMLVSEEAIADTVQILNAAKCDLSAFDVTGIKDGSTDYALTRTQSKVFCKKAKLSMSGKKFVTFADTVSAIEAANDPAAEYEIALLEDYDNGGALKFPKAGTYGKISITTGTKKFTFTGNVTLTGNTAISGNFYAFDSKKNVQSKYSISAANNCTFEATKADLGIINEIKGAKSDITLADVTFNAAMPVKITADKFTFSGITGIIDTLTVNTIKADGAQTLILLEKKQHKVNTEQDADSGKISVLMAGTDGNPAALKANAVIFASFKGDTFNVELDSDTFELSRETKNQFKVTATIPKA